jgi:hypothetical protein
MKELTKEQKLKIINDRNSGMSIGMLSFKYDLSILQLTNLFSGQTEKVNGKRQLIISND